MKKVLMLFLVLCFASFTGLYAQDNAGEPDPAQIGVSSAQQKLKEVSISKMEDAGLWYGLMPADEGIMQLRLFEGSPIDKEPIEGEVEAGIEEPDTNVIGGKVSFYHRGACTFSIKPVRPLPVPGIAKTISVWVAGRNMNHRLEVEVADHFGNKVLINMGKLNFVGWKKITVSVPPAVKQRNYHYNDKMGISILGFHVVCDLEETYGNYYIYLDDLRVVSDLFAEDSRDQDDILDSW